MRHIYIVGAKGVSFYGGYESFLQKLLEYHQNQTEIQYHVACKANGEGCMDLSQMKGISEVKDGHFTYMNADCFLVDVPRIGAAQAIAYDIKALEQCCKHIAEYHIQNAIVYILACRIGPFIGKYVKKIHKLGGTVFLNPDGHEWKRAKWSAPIRKYWKSSERLMVKHADLVICDSVNIEKYIQEEYRAFSPKTTYIAYGAETKESNLSDQDEKYTSWLLKHGIVGAYYLVVGRFVPENNYETIIREFMKCQTKKDLVIVTTQNDKFMNALEETLHYSRDKRIKFVGTVYDAELLTKIRECAFAYIHGHSVGGTNPSLLEALGATKLNLLYDIGFNQEVGMDSAFYWSLDEGNLAHLLDEVDDMAEAEIMQYGARAKKRIADAYSWQLIADQYRDVFTK